MDCGEEEEGLFSHCSSGMTGVAGGWVGSPWGSLRGSFWGRNCLRGSQRGSPRGSLCGIAQGIACELPGAQYQGYIGGT